MQWSSLRGADGVWGGNLVDTNTLFAGRDKTVHTVLGALAWLQLVTIGVPKGLALGSVLVLAIGNEVLEGARYRKYGWSRALSDIPDGTDVAVTLAGAGAGWAIQWLGSLLLGLL